jgi:addiction module HigA family antidote
MNAPPHVGEILRELYLEPLQISVTDAANHLGITRQALSRLLNEETGISAETAIRLSKAFGTSPEFWMNLSKQYELWQAMQKFKNIDIDPFAGLK